MPRSFPEKALARAGAVLPGCSGGALFPSSLTTLTRRVNRALYRARSLNRSLMIALIRNFIQRRRE